MNAPARTPAGSPSASGFPNDDESEQADWFDQRAAPGKSLGITSEDGCNLALDPG